MQIADREKSVRRSLLRVHEALDVQLENVGVAPLCCYDDELDLDDRHEE